MKIEWQMVAKPGSRSFTNFFKLPMSHGYRPKIIIEKAQQNIALKHLPINATSQQTLDYQVDNRKKLLYAFKQTNKYAYPNSCICYLGLYYKNSEAFGTAFLIGSNVAMTCAHNVYQRKQGQKVQNVFIYPSLNGKNGQHFKVENIIYPIQYETCEDQDKYLYDYCILYLGEVDLSQQYGYLGLSCSWTEVHQDITLYGYVNNQEMQNMKFQYGDVGQICEIDQNQILYSIYTSKGQSGSPIFIQVEKGVYQVIGVHCCKHKLKKLNFALRFNIKTQKQLFILLNKFQKTNLIVEHQNIQQKMHQINCKQNQPIYQSKVYSDQSNIYQYEARKPIKIQYIQNCEGQQKLKVHQFFQSLGVNDTNFFDPRGNKKFYITKNKIKYRGKWPYYQPINCKRLGINVLGRYDKGDDQWLGNTNNQGQWVVAYHGVRDPKDQNLFTMTGSSLTVLSSIFQAFRQGGTMLKMGLGQAYSNTRAINKKNENIQNSIYVSPHFQVCLPGYAKAVNVNGTDYRMVLQCRVNAKYLKVCSNNIYWAVNNSENIRPYGVLLCDNYQSKNLQIQKNRFGQQFVWEHYKPLIQGELSLKA